MMKYFLGLKEMPLFDFTKEDNCNEDLCLKITFNCGKLQSSVQVNFQKVKDEVENEIMECSLEGTFSHDAEKIAVLSYFDCDKKDVGTDVMEVRTNGFSKLIYTLKYFNHIFYPRLLCIKNWPSN